MTQPHPTPLECGRKLRAWRKLRGLTMDALGQQVGVSYQQVHKYESGSNTLSITMLYKMANVLGIKPVQLLPGDDAAVPTVENRRRLIAQQTLAGFSDREIDAFMAFALVIQNGARDPVTVVDFHAPARAGFTSEGKFTPLPPY